LATAILRCACEEIQWIVKALEGWSDEADRGFNSFNDLTVQRAAMNSLFVIAPYKYEGMWVFDDPEVGLSKEPFIAGIDTMIDKVVAGIPDADKGFRAVFSAAPFPGADFKLEWRREESGGNWYYSDQFKMEGWLCPALLKYFPRAPREIYVKVEPKG